MTIRDQISIRGAREHNLKNVELVLPREKLVLFTGISGSGKSSLAFDTIYGHHLDRVIPRDGKQALAKSVRRYIAALAGAYERE